MKTLNYLITLLCLAGLAMVANPLHAITVKATLIEASNEAAAPDERLKDYTPNLKRIFRYDSFRLIDSGSTEVGVPGAGAIGINGQQIKFNTAPAEKGRVRLSIDWRQGKRQIMQTTVSASSSSPTALGGPSTENGKLILVLEYE